MNDETDNIVYFPNTCPALADLQALRLAQQMHGVARGIVNIKGINMDITFTKRFNDNEFQTIVQGIMNKVEERKKITN